MQQLLLYSYHRWLKKRDDSRTLPNPDIRMIQKAESCTDQLPYPHPLEEAELAERSECAKDLRHHSFFHI